MLSETGKQVEVDHLDHGSIAVKLRFLLDTSREALCITVLYRTVPYCSRCVYACRVRLVQYLAI